jgi:hypothetical protein
MRTDFLPATSLRGYESLCGNDFSPGGRVLAVIDLFGVWEYAGNHLDVLFIVYSSALPSVKYSNGLGSNASSLEFSFSSEKYSNALGSSASSPEFSSPSAR